jgi:hypothetical protein
MSKFFAHLRQSVPNVHLRRFLIIICCLFVVEVATGFISHMASDDPRRMSLSRSSGAGGSLQDENTSDEQDPDSVQFPPHASSKYLSNIPPDQFVSELVVQSPPDTDNYNVIKVERAVGAVPILIVYIEPGRQVRMLLPPSKYRIKLARGKTWLGDKDLFGKGTRAYLTNIVDLSPRRDGSNASATVSLQGFVDGTTRGGLGIRKEQF